MVSELLTEVISIIWKTFHRTSSDPRAGQMLSQKLLEDLQLLLGCKHALLLRCVLECLLTFLESEQLTVHFGNSYTVDMLL